MNQGTISGIIKSEFKQIGNDENKGIRFTVGISTNPKNPDAVENFEVVARNANAELLESTAKKGSRVNLDYRLGSDKVDEGHYDNVLVVNKVLGVMDAKAGTDFAVVTVGGTAKFRRLNTTPNNSSVLNASVTILKEFQGRVSKTFTDVALWNSLAEANADKQEQEVDMVVIGSPKSKEVEGKFKIDIWANSVMFVAASEGGESSTSSEGESSAKDEKPKRQFRQRSQSNDDIEF